MILKRETRTDINIASPYTVLTYTHTNVKPVEVMVRIDLSGLSGVAGVYSGIITLNGMPMLPASNISTTTGTTQAVLSSKIFVLDETDAVVIQVNGLPSDTTVDTVTTIYDVTPATINDLVGYGSVEVDHNYGGANALAFQTSGGAAIAGADIHVFSKSDWDDYNRHPSFALARAVTTQDQGRWVQSVLLNPGQYVLRYTKEGYYQSTASITVV